MGDSVPDGGSENNTSKETGEQQQEEEEVDFYAVLGVQTSATGDEIKAAYKKLAIKWHPDKNRHQEELASAKFKQVSTAYHVLIDPATRTKYDAKGFEGLNEKDLTNIELDISSMGTMNSVFASIFNRLGVLSVKTMVAASVLENAESGKAQLRPLTFGRPVTDRVDKNCAHYYNFTVTNENIEQGFCVWVKSPSSRFKVLMFEKREREREEERQWRWRWRCAMEARHAAAGGLDERAQAPRGWDLLLHLQHLQPRPSPLYPPVCG
jgi:curved DNA-binding protein CbpA